MQEVHLLKREYSQKLVAESNVKYAGLLSQRVLKGLFRSVLFFELSRFRAEMPLSYYREVKS